MKILSSFKTNPATWLACLFIACGPLNLRALGQDAHAVTLTKKNWFAVIRDGIDPIKIDPNPPPPNKVDVRRAAQLLREHIAKIREKARQGDHRAIYNMGVVYLFGAGVPLDHELAFKYFQKSAEEAVYAPACFNLAICYAMGNGTKVDLIRAHKWWNLAAQQGHPFAAKARDKIAKILKSPQIEAAERMTRGYQEKLENRVKLEKLKGRRFKRLRPDLSDDAAYLLSQHLFLNRGKPNPTGGID